MENDAAPGGAVAEHTPQPAEQSVDEAAPPADLARPSVIGTKINKLILEGFKSFGKRTEFVFADDFNCIIGPNGSGKSNVIDALCFVLGKTSAKSMRATNSANLIYNGGKSAPAGKQAEVTIVFDNSTKVFPLPDEEVRITRIVRSDGQSKYKINNKTHTREQMIELLSAARINPDGYNIVLQGDIAGFCQMPSGERREIVEEIAGIGLYEERKQAALRDLTKVEERLNQAEIILKEREGFLKDLKKDRDQALKYKELSDNIKVSKGSYLKLQMNKKDAELAKLNEQTGKHKVKFDEYTGRINGFREQIRTQRDELQRINAELEQKGEKEQLQLQKQLEQLRVEQAGTLARVQTLKQELSRLGQRKEQMGKNLDELDGKLAQMDERKQSYTGRLEAIGKDLRYIDERMKEFRKKHNIADDSSDIENGIRDLDGKSEEKAREVQQLGEKRQNLLREQDVITFKLQTIDEQIKKVVGLEKEHEGELSILRQKKEEFKKAVLELNQILNDDSRMAAELAGGRAKALKCAEELAKFEVKQAAQQESIAGNIAVKRILEQRKSMPGVYGTVAELGSVSGKYGTALEVSAANRIHSIVVEDDKIAQKCIDYLKGAKLGIATFLPLNKMSAAPRKEDLRKLSTEKGVIGLAIDLIKYDPAYRDAFNYVFGSTLVVDNLTTARRIGIGKVRMVTLEGDLCELSGAMIGGHRAKKTGVFGDEDLSGKIAQINEEIATIQSSISTTEKRKKQNEERITTLREFKANLEGDIIKTEKSLRVDTSDLDASKDYKKEISKRSKDIEKELETLGEEQSERTRELAQLKIERQKLLDQLTTQRNPRLQAELNTFNDKKRELENEKLIIDTELKNLQQQREELVGKETSGTKDVLAQLDAEAVTFTSEQKELDKHLKGLERDIKTKEKEQDAFQSQFKQLFTRSKKLNEGITDHEKKAYAIEDEARQEEIKLNTFSIEGARVKAEHASIAAEFEQYAGVSLQLEKSEDHLKKEIADFEKMRANVGSVNMRALDIYDAAATEFASLVQKKDTLVQEKDSVVMMMNEIETRKKDIFLQTLAKLQTNFARIFSQLTSKGEVELVLEDPETIFEEGLDIKVRLTGNKFLDMRSLSGGEKTLVALAFIFAVQEFAPASFYVLDEVDAALDKRNAERLGKLIAQYSQNAQYVVVSHNDAVITEAPILYGVSLADHGVSKVVGLKL